MFKLTHFQTWNLIFPWRQQHTWSRGQFLSLAHHAKLSWKEFFIFFNYRSRHSARNTLLLLMLEANKHCVEYKANLKTISFFKFSDNGCRKTRASLRVQPEPDVPRRNDDLNSTSASAAPPSGSATSIHGPASTPPPTHVSWGALQRYDVTSGETSERIYSGSQKRWLLLG